MQEVLPLDQKWQSYRKQSYSDLIPLIINKNPRVDTFRFISVSKRFVQAACCLNIWLCPLVDQLVRQLVSFVKKKMQATSKQSRSLSFGMLTALTNLRSTKVLHHVSCIMHHASCTLGHFETRQKAEIRYIDCSQKYKSN